MIHSSKDDSVVQPYAWEPPTKTMNADSEITSNVQGSRRTVHAVYREKLIFWPPSPDALLWRIVRPVGMAAPVSDRLGTGCALSHSDLFPTPGNVVRGIFELGRERPAFEIHRRFALSCDLGFHARPGARRFRWVDPRLVFAAPFRLSIRSSRFCARSRPSRGFQWRSSGLA